MFSPVFAALFLLLGLALPVQGADLALVLSENGGPYAEYVSALHEWAASSPWRIRWVGSPESLDSAPPSDLIITVGAEAGRAVLRRPGKTPVLATLVSRSAFEGALTEAAPGRRRDNVSSIFLDQPAPRLLALIRHLLPDRLRVGVLAGPETRGRLTQLQKAIAAASLTLEMESVERETNPVSATNQLLARSDLLLALPESGVYRRDQVRGILLASYRFQRPVIGFSPAMATSGALAVLYSTPTQMARQTQELLKAQRPEALVLPAPQAPSHFVISINHPVAQALGLKLPDESALHRTLAADKEAR